MATRAELINAIRAAAKELLHREPTDAEISEVLREFEQAQGTPYRKSIRALSKGTRLTEGQIEKQANASDNTDRKIQDLAGVIDAL